MVLPILIAIGATVGALTAKAVLKTYSRCLRLTPTEIAKLNGYRTKDSHLYKIDPLKLKFAQYPGGFKKTMTESEALLILDITEPEDVLKLTPEILKKKHRKAMILNHPDKGGSPYLATKINLAKDTLEHGHFFK
ncbi:unnamed protein product [[Candida] boidinii]|uniref:Unnamed protein product n=1 Tax=Candida boidinii TaxID=5477 RepID=A0ACB5THX6_CANBO|nr:unnamed protein product [[Candida] boidinii]